MQFNHALIFGGTGMLAQATGWISEHANHTIAFGRSQNRLQRLEKQYGENGLRALQLDYRDTVSLEKAIKSSHMKFGKIDLVVAWIHSTAPDAIPTIKKQISALQKDQEWTLILVKGSSSHLASITESEMDVPGNCVVKEVQLGFVYDGVSSRWLTHEEISEGVIAAIQSAQSKTVVGMLEPWDKRP